MHSNSTVAVIDSQVAGIAGDMLLAALVDAGANKGRVLDAIFQIQNFLAGSSIAKADFVRTRSHGFSACQLELAYKDSVHERSGGEMFRSLSKLCDSLPLEQRAKVFALESFKTIALAEAKIHGETLEDVHLHEASSIDTFVDIIGTSLALQDLKLFDGNVLSTRVAVGGGLLHFSHGTTPNPGSAVLEILKNKSFVLLGGQADEELTTPTGASLLVNIASNCVLSYPEMTVDKVGYGAGKKQFKGFANLLRLVVGTSPSIYQGDRVALIETNLDDVTGEVVGNMIEKLSAAGAKDVTVLPGITKKNRPAYLVRIISDHALLSTMLEILFAESGTLGARISEVERIVLPRAKVVLQVSIEGQAHEVRVKVVRDSRGRFVSAKAEYDDLKKISESRDIPLKKVMDVVNLRIAQDLGGFGTS